ncbi:MAG: hypothetical protein K8J31_08190 [Anaerolineae bacterium]|nr:hypothetical protein [Anaerolineae bacterium]
MIAGLETLVNLGCFALGAITVYVTLASAVRTFVVPRAQNAFLTRLVFLNMWSLFQLYIRWRKIDTYEGRDRVLNYFAPVTVLILPLVWVTYIILGYMFMYWSMGVRGWEQALTISGSSFLTLGTTPFINLPITLFQFTEATLGLGMVALLISYLPTMYSNFSRREATVELLSVRAGSPPSAIEMISRIHRIRGLDYLHELWEEWEIWFTELEESHTSLAPLIWFRSPQPENSWITAAGTVMDAAALVTSTVDIPRDPSAQLCIRAGFIALRRITDFFFYRYDTNPHYPQTPISITRQEFDDAYDELAAAGVPLKAGRDQCWLDFAGWRVNYEETLLFLANITQAPYAPWISDRGQPLTSEQFRSRYGRRDH